MLLLGGLLAGFAPLGGASELSTLFTTPQERQLINANRYKLDEPRVQPVVVEPDELIVEPDASPVQLLIQEEVSVDYQVSGISLATDGSHTVWINGSAYEDGAELDDGSRVKIMGGNDIRVRITAPDGKHYYATSGESLVVTYMAAVEN